MRGGLWVAAAVVAAGGLLRVAAYQSLDGMLPADGLYVDERLYAEGFEALGRLSFERPPGMFVLGGLGGAADHPEAARWAMAVLSLVPALALALAMRGRGWWGWAVPLAVALQPDLILFGLQLLPAVPAAVAVTGALLALARGRRVAAGLLMGLACLFRAELALALPLMALMPPWGLSDWLRTAVPWAAVLAPVMLLNLVSGGGPVISTNGPENLWLGSRRSTMETPPGVEFEQLVRVGGRQQEAFLERALESISSSPGSWLMLGLRKTAMSLSIPGPGRNLEVGYLMGGMGLRPLLLPMLLLFALGVWRLLLPERATGPDLSLRRAMVAGMLLSAFVLLPAARYRLAVMPALWMAAAGAAPRRREVAGWAAVSAALVVLFLLMPNPVRPGLTQVQQAERLIDRGRPGMALESLRRARSRGYRGADLHNLAGIALSMGGRGVSALESFGAALDTAPLSPTVWRNAAVCLADLGRWEEASGAARRAVELNSGLEDELAPLLR